MIARILIDLRRTAVEGSAFLATKAEVQASMQRVAGQFFAPRYTRALHAFRGGREVPEGMFLDLFQRSYFDGHLAAKYRLMRCAFPASIHGQVFVDTCLTETFFDELMGIFMCNNQCVRVEGLGGHVLVGTSLHETYSKMNHSCTPNIRNIALMTHAGGGGDGAVGMHANVAVAAAAAAAAAAGPIGAVLPKIPPSVSLVAVAAGVRAGEGAGVVVGIDQVFEMQLQGQEALLPVVPLVAVESASPGLAMPAAAAVAVSVAVPVAVEERYERVGVSVYATQDIPVGQQVRTCYLPSGSGQGLSWLQRHKALAQYLFQCDCGMCEEGRRTALADADY